ncbi:MAG TPA: 30S ribosomal protein S4e [Candidatus Korarchaeota archaeon]|nr:30S ribosomal protein S4e [Candidatus Korarchaeota archaeon]
MGRKGSTAHLKRLASPKHWPVPRRIKKWVARPKPGPHGIEEGVPLLVLVRDILGLALTGREARKIISQKRIHVDGRPRYDYKFIVGLMDVISIPDMGLYLRLVPDPKHLIKPIEIPKEESDKKLVKVERKVPIKGGRLQIQIGTHDGRNFVVDPDSEYFGISLGDSLLIKVPKQEILGHFPLKEGYVGVILKGENAGRICKIEKVGELIEAKDLDNQERTYNVLPRNILVVGEVAPVIKVREK